MAFRDVLVKIAKDTARDTAQTIFALRLLQFNQNKAGLVRVVKVKGNKVTVNKGGKETEVTNAGGRIVGEGDSMVTDGKSYGL